MSSNRVQPEPGNDNDLENRTDRKKFVRNKKIFILSIAVGCFIVGALLVGLPVGLFSPLCQG